MIGNRRPHVLLALPLLAMLLTVLGPAPAQTAPAPGAALPSGLTIGQRSEPADVDDLTRPILGWQVPSEVQTAYQVQVAESRSALASGRLVWDSDKVSSDTSTNVPYTGPALERGEGYDWRVRTWGGSGQASPWSLPAHFGTALGADWGDSEPIWLAEPEPLGWSDYTLEATFSITTQNATIVFNAEDANNYLMWQFRGDGVNQLAPHQRVNGTFQQLKTVPARRQPRARHRLPFRIVPAGSTVRTFLDGRPGGHHRERPLHARHASASAPVAASSNSWDDLNVTAADRNGALPERLRGTPPATSAAAPSAGGRLHIGTGQNCVYGLGGTDWAFLRGDFETPADKDIAWATVFATGSSTAPGAPVRLQALAQRPFVGLGPTQPISTETRYDGFDVTDLAAAGRTNALGAIAWTTRDQRFQAQLVVEYTDGSAANVRDRPGTGPRCQGRRSTRGRQHRHALLHRAEGEPPGGNVPLRLRPTRASTLPAGSRRMSRRRTPTSRRPRPQGDQQLEVPGRGRREGPRQLLHRLRTDVDRRR